MEAGKASVVCNASKLLHHLYFACQINYHDFVVYNKSGNQLKSFSPVIRGCATGIDPSPTANLFRNTALIYYIAHVTKYWPPVGCYDSDPKGLEFQVVGVSIEINIDMFLPLQ